MEVIEHVGKREVDACLISQGVDDGFGHIVERLYDRNLAIKERSRKKSLYQGNEDERHSFSMIKVSDSLEHSIAQILHSCA